MNSFIIKSFIGGISGKEDSGIPGSAKMLVNADIRKKLNSLSCQQGLIDEGGATVVDLIRKWVPCLDGNAYGFGSTGKIYKRTVLGVITLVYTDSEAITGAEEWYFANGKTYLTWATPTKLHIKEIPGVTNWSDVDATVTVNAVNYTYPKTNLTSSTNHFMAQAVGALMIANEDKIGLLSYDGSYTTDSVNLFKKYYAKTIQERGNYVIFGANDKSGEPKGALFQWDNLSGSWNNKKGVFSGVINALIDTEIPLAQVGTDGQIYYSDLSSGLPIIKIPGGGYCNPGGVTNDGNLALFGIYGNSNNHNGIYSYGRKELNLNRILNFEYNIGACDEIGAIAKVGTDILISYKVGTSFYSKRIDTTAKATAYYYSLDLIPPEKLNYIPNWQNIAVYTKALPSGCKVECFYRLDKKDGGDSQGWIQAKMEDGLAVFDTATGTEAVFMTGELAKVFEVQLKLTPYANTTPDVLKVEVYFE